jgi:hypothetical protein
MAPGLQIPCFMQRHTTRVLRQTASNRLLVAATSATAALAVVTCVVGLLAVAGCTECNDTCEIIGANYGGGDLQLEAAPYTGDPLSLTVAGAEQAELDEATSESRPFYPCQIGGDEHAHLLVDQSQRWLRACGRPLGATLAAPCTDTTDHFSLSLTTDLDLVGAGPVPLAGVGSFDLRLTREGGDVIQVTELDSEAEVEWFTETSGRLWIPDASLLESDCQIGSALQEYGLGEIELTWTLDAAVASDACVAQVCL